MYGRLDSMSLAQFAPPPVPDAVEVRQFVREAMRSDHHAAHNNGQSIPSDYYVQTLVNPTISVDSIALTEDEVRSVVQENRVATALHFYQCITSTCLGEHLPPRAMRKGFEVLGRGLHTDGRVIGYSSLEAQAETLGLSKEFSLKIIEESCHLANAVNADPQYKKISASANITTELLWSARFEHDIARILDATEIDPQYLTLELLEKIHIPPSTSIKALRHLTRRGVHLAIDDYGEDYSVALLEHLHSYDVPVHVMKFDGKRLRNVRSEETEKFVQTALRHADYAGVESIVWEGYNRTRPDDVAFLSVLKRRLHARLPWLFQGRVMASSGGAVPPMPKYYVEE